MAQLNLVTPADTAGAHRHIGEKSNSSKANGSPPRSGELPLTTPRASRSAEARKDPARRHDQPAAPRLTRFNVAAADAPATADIPRNWLRPLLVVLMLVALVPNLTLVAIVWLGLIDMPWSKPLAPLQPAVLTSAPAPAVLTAPATVEAFGGEVVAFPIALDGTDGVPARSIIAISGLPAGSTFSDGRPYGDTEWNLKPDQIGDLHLAVPSTANGVSKLAIKLITPDDKVIADAGTLLNVTTAAAVATPPALMLVPQASGAVPAAADVQIKGSLPAAEQAGSDAAAAGTPAAESPAGDAKTSPFQPAERGGADDPSSFVRPLAYVNFRDGPSSASRVIGVIAKGAKVPVLERKRGWLQVTNPATSEKGWIYSGYVEGGHKARPRVKRPASNDTEQKADTSAFWNWLSQ